MSLCGMKTVDLTSNTLKLLGRYFSCNKKCQNQINFLKAIIDIQSVLRLWRMRNLTLEGRIIIFKTLTFYEIVYLALLVIFPDYIINKRGIIP